MDAAPALAGITVLDLGQVYLGPYCTMLMSRLGADVIKIEPATGEPIRWREAVGGAQSAAFMLLNAGKRSLRLDLKSDAGRDLFHRLAEDADVVVENFAPGTLARLGIDYESLSRANPRLVLASGKGYGSAGPYRDYKAMDLTVQAMSGVMATTGFPDDPPVKAGPALADFLGGIHLFAAIVTALYQRTVTGRGQLVEVSMHDAVLPTLASNLSGWLDSGGALPQRTGNRHGGMAVAPYNVYPAADGWVAVIALGNRHWLDLCAAMGRDDLGADSRYSTPRERVAHVEEVDEFVSGWTRTLPKAEIFARLDAAGVPVAPVVEVHELLEDPQVQAQEMLFEVGDGPDAALAFGSPLRLSASPPVAPAPAPAVGEHSDEILRERLGLSDEQIAGLRALGVL